MKWTKFAFGPDLWAGHLQVDLLSAAQVTLSTRQLPKLLH